MEINPLNLFKQETDTARFHHGDTIFDRGDSADNMYIVKEGEVDIRVNGATVETVAPGGIFGEMALIDSSPRAAAAVARTDCQLVKVDQRRFTFLIQQTPFFAVHVMRVLANRLRKTTAAVNK